MDSSRRDALTLGLGAIALVPGLPATAASTDRSDRCAALAPPARARGIEGQRKADLGDGRFLNPVMPGDHPDPTILKDGADYYMTFSSFIYYPGIVIWHSRDLVNWTPVGPALTTMIGSVYALDLVKHAGRYFIYVPAISLKTPLPGETVRMTIYAIHAEHIGGPWSEPVDMGIYGYIDPGHAVGEDGRRYLFLSDGHRVRISDDGLRRDGAIERVYAGWAYPEDWTVEGFALEGPKIMRRDGWFYMFSAEGGTGGPPTSHMVIVARSRSIDGPWHNDPANPVVRTADPHEPWWSRGHGTMVEGPSGDWWMVYHGYENGYRTLGRQMLLEPMAWTSDGWPRALGGTLAAPLAMPRGGTAVAHGLALSDDFSGDMLGTRLAFYAPEPDYLTRVHRTDNALIVAGRGRGPGDSSPLTVIVGDHSYEITIDIALSGAAEAGLLLFYDEELFCGLGASDRGFHLYQRGRVNYAQPDTPPLPTVSLRLRNDDNVVTFGSSADRRQWTKQASFEVAGYNHNVGDRFLSLRPALYVAGAGDATFRNLRYAAIA